MEIATVRGRLRAAFPKVDHRGMRVVRAPGRVNLIGEHTDYNDGFVLPAAIGLEVWIGFVRTDDGRVEMVLEDGSRDGFDLDGVMSARGGWIQRMAGMAWALAEQDLEPRGLRGVLLSEIPIGAGLSSSAAVEVATAWALLDDRPLEPMAIARAAQRAENGFVGVQSGIMDPFASAFGRRDSALLVDCRSLEYRPVPLPVDRYAIVACDTRAPHRLESSEYNARRAQCEAVVALVAELQPEVRSLRDVTLEMLAAVDDLDPVLRRRADHVVRENERVMRAVEALEGGQPEALGGLFAESHASLRELYEVSSPELDLLVEIAVSTPGVLGARMTGAGFGGCTVNLVEAASVDRFRSSVERRYEAGTGRPPGVYVVDAVAGAGEVSV
ncbi:MAG: galactokinase [Candidatus Limnocylindria bacterium]